MSKKNISFYADKIFTGRFTGTLLFGCIMAAVFFLTFDVGDTFLKEGLSKTINSLTEHLNYFLCKLNISPSLRTLIIEGICAGIGSVLSFVPTIAILFFCLAILEESGYMDRAAIAMSRPMSFLGLPGRSVISLVSGFGCSVPAIISASALPHKKDRLHTIALIPFMSCSAKLPIYIIFTETFFPECKLLIIGTIYFIGIFSALVYAIILKILSTKKIICLKSISSSPVKNSVFPMSSYRLPSIKSVLQKVWQAVKGFIKKAFTVILLASLVIWLLQNFDIHMNTVSSPDESILADLGKSLSPLFYPLGFDDWRAVSSIITGISAKEAVIGTLTILAESSGADNLPFFIYDIFSPLSAFSFMVFCLLYFPCIPSVTAVKNVTGKWSFAVYMLLFNTALAWITSFVVSNLGELLLSI